MENRWPPELNGGELIAGLKDDADVEREVGLELPLKPFAPKVLSSKDTICEFVVGCAQQTVRKPLQDPATIPLFKRHPNMGSQKPPDCRHATVDRLIDEMDELFTNVPWTSVNVEMRK